MQTMNKAIEEYSMETARFLAKSEEKIIAKFMEIAGLGDKYQEAITSERGNFRNYKIALLADELNARGYKIGMWSDDRLPLRVGIDDRMMWQLFLLHDGERIASNIIEIKINTMQLFGRRREIK